MSGGTLLHGAATGVAFGALLQKGRASSYDTIVDQLMLEDWTVSELMAGAAAVSGVGAELLRRSGRYAPSIKPLRVGGLVLGGAAFGAGMAVLGYCPGTCVAAAGEGRRDAWAGLAGMLVGAGAFVALRRTLRPILEAGDFGARTVPEQTGTSPWPWLALLGGAAAAAALAASRSGE